MPERGSLRPAGIARLARGRFFYGWVVVGAAWIAMFVSSGATMSFATFFPALLDDFGWTRARVSLGFSLYTLTMALMGPIAGALLDKLGPRRMVLLGGTLGGLAFLLISRVASPWHFYLTYGLLAPIGMILGSALPTVATVRRWFTRRAGFTVALAMTGSGAGVALSPQIAGFLIDHYGWRWAYVGYGIIIFVGAALAALLIRRDPESSGTYPDGRKLEEAELRARVDFMARAERWSLAQAMRTRTFWLFLVAQFAFALIALGVLSQLIAWAQKDLHFSAGTARFTFTLMATLAIAGRLFGGSLSDWYMARSRGFFSSRKPVLLLCNLGIAAGMFWALFVSSLGPYVGLVVLLGFCYGIGLGVFPTYLGDLFGVANMPTLFGWTQMATAGFGALSAWYFPFIFGRAGSYDLAWLISGFLCGLSTICLLFIRPPAKRKAPVPMQA